MLNLHVSIVKMIYLSLRQAWQFVVKAWQHSSESREWHCERERQQFELERYSQISRYGPPFI